MALSMVPSPERSRTRTWSSPDRIGIGDDVIGQRHHRLRIAGAERPRPRDRLDQRGIGAGGAHRAVDQQRLVGARRGDPLRQFAFEIGAEFRQRAVLAP